MEAKKIKASAAMMCVGQPPWCLNQSKYDCLSRDQRNGPYAVDYGGVGLRLQPATGILDGAVSSRR